MAFLIKNCLLLEASKTDLTISKKFNCGDQELTDFFTEKSTLFKSQLFGKTYCFVLKALPSEIIAAFTISNGSIHLLSLPNNRKKILNQTVPREKLSQFFLPRFKKLHITNYLQNKNLKHVYSFLTW